MTERDREPEQPSGRGPGPPVRGTAARSERDQEVGLRPVWSEVDLGAVRANVRALAARARPAQFLAVVKADGYGHGAVPIATAALEAGADWLGVALVEEGVELRAAGIDAPILVLSEPAPDAATAVVEHDLRTVVYTPGGIDAVATAVAKTAASGHGRGPLGVHLKVDTGMHRVGCTPEGALELAEIVAGHPELVLEGVCTHLAVADQTGHPYTTEQLATFDRLLDELDARGLRPRLAHAANSAALLGDRDARYDLVRSGIAIYGVAPGPDALPSDVVLQPALSLRARVGHVQSLGAGARISYGLRYELARAANVATVPVGYADGVPRNLGLVGGEVLIRGHRLPIAGVITMDQLMVDAGDVPVEVGDEVVLLGRQGDDEITATEWAEQLGTIAYEVVTGIGPRVPRRYR